MRVVLQRVAHASVDIDGVPPARIGPGLLLLAGFTFGDAEEDLLWMVDKVLGLRIFQDSEGKMNLSVEDRGGEVMVVSQFTLYGDTRKGRRPSFVQAAPPEISIPLYERFVERLRERLPGRVATGEFGAAMRVSLLNEGPVTLVLERGPSGPGGTPSSEGAEALR
jgi:D-aminoacyl-tRNA deacylase